MHDKDAGLETYLRENIFGEKLVKEYIFKEIG